MFTCEALQESDESNLFGSNVTWVIVSLVRKSMPYKYQSYQSLNRYRYFSKMYWKKYQVIQAYFGCTGLYRPTPTDIGVLVGTIKK